MRFTPRPNIEVIAHRGASAHAPEHTFAAYDLALEQGADALELDVRMTADRGLVVVHDPTLLRTAGDPRRVEDLALGELMALARPPLTLASVFARYGASTGYLVELKDPRPWLPRRVLETIAGARVADRVVVQSFNGAWLRRLRMLDPGVPVARLIPPWRMRRGITGSLDTAAESFSGIGVWHRTIDATLVAEARSRGLVVRAWTANEPADIARLAAIGVDGVITDAPGRAKAAAAGVQQLGRAA